MLDFQQDVRLDFGVVLNIAESWIPHSISKDLLVVQSVVEHLKESNRPDRVDASGKGRCVAEDQNVQGIAVLCESLRDETIIAGEMYRGM